ncbi:MAG: hypothetical protein A3D31_15040 [Candidatus Fluviicola riflensis]|nr:MAG: hypothetical protein CHH17_19475 [Candidatus Fluviicola riflensis]OGS78279.1 MAG: hypothetical protein A3D31_15040 [Candidatus Fluviicola riflensis]OGS85345.1 MAG: hypothetical protein A2724_11975 [Fluviicola sp. RIFCSPHIGHO2_01_FULL_43_53]OGS87387.1 MAG: hypothetical protein A3E30_08395 [Fluviicola sp. RIFCSPHIGHO2_12_FULL_43_24]
MDSPTKLDYGIYIDPDKAFVFSKNPFDETVPVLTRIELNLQPADHVPHESVLKVQMENFVGRILSLLQTPRRILIFGPSDEKYTLFKAIQARHGFSDLEKTVLVAPPEEYPEPAQLFFEHYFVLHSAF